MTGTDAFTTITLAPLPAPMQRLRAQMLAAGWRAESPAGLDAAAEQLAREERQDA